ncbi:MAG: hypothetical protein CVU84_09600 [Firmicutes bacterium HGW-Firmicutes-1]|jgi:diguanylate cyclase (GGDEF)-like protein|nr:MAG: hypothetical protein CVU84_09600 [Firmicutes bacterium HGW-Firmicutes-1]
MKNIHINQPEIHLSKFKDPTMENEYMNTQIHALKRLIRLGMLIFGFAFLIFLIPDYLFNQSVDFKIKMTILRLAVFLIILFAVFLLSKLKHWKHIFGIITICEFLVGSFFLYTGTQYEHPHFMLQLLSLIIIQLVFFIIPNRLHNCLLVSFLTWAIFIINSSYTIQNIPKNEYLSGFIFPLLFMLAFSYWHIRFQDEKRIQYNTNQQLVRLLYHDALTNIYNRFKFETEVNHFLSKSDSVPLALTLLDIDYFKQINDTHGHLFGDRVLVFLANLINSHLGPKDLFARWGGEEFVILFYNCSLEEAVKKIQAIKNTLDASSIEGHQCTCSYGITELQPNDTLDCLVHRADQLMYQAKEGGRNRIVY